ncbi:methylenetetrahydrofolate reductase [Paenibacillus humicola]|uniref:methylenetetrahydrofolate reductase n=1 Tax=Paenibacillus humicola TaxID=3110540 RepID=UPI00237B00E6|nr:methylenetetrahydrofolate reductase [Paenibacillus humicola]
MLKQKLLNRQPGILTYGMTPPKAVYTPDKIAEIAQKQLARIEALPIDALLLYDVQEEADRAAEQERPFPYLPMVDPSQYGDLYFRGLPVPQIIYRCVGKYTEARLEEWIKANSEHDKYAVYVGASSSNQEVHLDVASAARLSKRVQPDFHFGGVVIPERHTKKQDEHLRVVNKIRDGCSFFVSQATYNVEASKNFLSDYYYTCTNNGIVMAPVLFNLAPCGSAKTLEFMKWLGISIPKWLENELKYSSDVLDKSLVLARQLFEELLDFSLEKGIPIGCSVESVSTRKVEIEASVQLVRDIKSLFDRKLPSA